MRWRICIREVVEGQVPAQWVKRKDATQTFPCKLVRLRGAPWESIRENSGSAP
jgi:hypothetical protein